MLAALSAKNKIEIVKVTIPKARPDSTNFSFYDSSNDMIISWIINTLSSELTTSVMCFARSRKSGFI